MIFVRFRS